MSILQQNAVCPAILTGLSSLLNEDPNMFITPIGGVQSTLDPENRRGVTMEQLQDAGEGHAKIVRVKHKQRAIPADVGDEKNCDPGEEKPYFEELFEVNQHAQHVIKMKEATVRTLCDAYSQWLKVGATVQDIKGQSYPLQVMREMAEEIMMDLDAVRQKVNRDFLTFVAANLGLYVGGDASKSFNVIKTADHALVLTGFNQFKQELRKINGGQTPIVFGGGNMDLALSATAFGCCNNAGQDFGVMRSQGAGFKFYQDYEDMNTYLGDANAFVAFMPKTLQTITFNKYVGNFATQIGNMIRGTMPDPSLPGIKYDIRLIPSECAEEFDFFINLDYDFYAAPDNIYQAGDRLAGVNGILKGIATAS